MITFIESLTIREYTTRMPLLTVEHLEQSRLLPHEQAPWSSLRYSSVLTHVPLALFPQVHDVGHESLALLLGGLGRLRTKKTLHARR